MSAVLFLMMFNLNANAQDTLRTHVVAPSDVQPICVSIKEAECQLLRERVENELAEGASSLDLVIRTDGSIRITRNYD